eukprot:TRINITY_DN17589_c0_g1_i1.p1 TRINITY_DN17589_c0_g1~~TRINITY_DN17589_c0_g1_i1.p1  ORF type:complete len:238 (-),score=79.76 TRINITY_DN17589_c0_g1_i1:78-791(-)
MSKKSDRSRVTQKLLLEMGQMFTRLAHELESEDDSSSDEHQSKVEKKEKDKPKGKKRAAKDDEEPDKKKRATRTRREETKWSVKQLDDFNDLCQQHEFDGKKVKADFLAMYPAIDPKEVESRFVIWAASSKNPVPKPRAVRIRTSKETAEAPQGSKKDNAEEADPDSEVEVAPAKRTSTKATPVQASSKKPTASVTPKANGTTTTGKQTPSKTPKQTVASAKKTPTTPSKKQDEDDD